MEQGCWQSPSGAWRRVESPLSVKEISEDCLEEAFEPHQIWPDLCGLSSTPCRPCPASFHLPDSAPSVKKERSGGRDASGRRAGKGGAGTSKRWSWQRTGLCKDPEVGDVRRDISCSLWPGSSFCEGFPGGTSSKEPARQCRRQRRRQCDPWVGKVPLERGMKTRSSILAWRI